MTILDTGIDLRNAHIAQKRGRIKCYPDAASCHDTNGHGTHVAHILLRLVPNIELHVAKISESDLLTKVKITRITEV